WVPVDAAPSIPVLIFAAGVSLISGVLVGVAPAWMASRADPIDALRGANRAGGHQRGVFGAPKTLGGAQAGGSPVVLSAASMLGQSLRNLEHQNFGFDTRGRFLVSIDPRLSNYRQEQLVPLFRNIEERLRTIPGIRMASPALYGPLSGGYWAHDIRVE